MMLLKRLIALTFLHLAFVTVPAENGPSGQAVRLLQPAPIRVGPASNSRVLYRAEQFELILVSPSKQQGWLIVPMQDGTVGFIRQEAVAPFKVGQFLENTVIRVSPKKTAKGYSSAKQYDYVIVTPAKEAGWVRVPLVNGAYGFVAAEHVAQLQVDAAFDQKAPDAMRRTTGSAAARGDVGANVAANSLQYLGTPYKWGGNDLQNGIDCSGFVKQLFGKIGVNLPRTAAEQALVGQAITRLEDLQPGDRLYFWEEKRKKIGHTGIYLGNGYFSHSSSGRKGVTTDSLDTPKWRNILFAARR